MFGVKVDKADPTDLYEQVAGEIRRAIAQGRPSPESGCRPQRTSRRSRRQHEHRAPGVAVDELVQIIENAG